MAPGVSSGPVQEAPAGGPPSCPRMVGRAGALRARDFTARLVMMRCGAAAGGPANHQQLLRPCSEGQYRDQTTPLRPPPAQQVSRRMPSRDAKGLPLGPLRDRPACNTRLPLLGHLLQPLTPSPPPINENMLPAFAQQSHPPLPLSLSGRPCHGPASCHGASHASRVAAMMRRGRAEARPTAASHAVVRRGRYTSTVYRHVYRHTGTVYRYTVSIPYCQGTVYRTIGGGTRAASQGRAAPQEHCAETQTGGARGRGDRHAGETADTARQPAPSFCHGAIRARISARLAGRQPVRGPVRAEFKWRGVGRGGTRMDAGREHEDQLPLPPQIVIEFKH